MSKEIPVTGSDRPAIVDDQDFEWAMHKYPTEFELGGGPERS